MVVSYGDNTNFQKIKINYNVLGSTFLNRNYMTVIYVRETYISVGIVNYRGGRVWERTR